MHRPDEFAADFLQVRQAPRALAGIDMRAGGTSFYVLKLTWRADFLARFEFIPDV